MKTEVSPLHLTEALARAHQHWEARRGEGWVPETAVPTAFSIAISREAGSYGAALARSVGDRLGWPVYDRELLQHIADDLGVRRTLLESLDEKQVSWLSDCMSGLFSDSTVNEFAYFRRLAELLLSLASHGEYVVVGRGASFIMPLATTLRVRVVAPLAHRANAVQREHGVTLKEATAARRDRGSGAKSLCRGSPSHRSDQPGKLRLTPERVSVLDRRMCRPGPCRPRPLAKARDIESLNPRRAGNRQRLIDKPCHRVDYPG